MSVTVRDGHVVEDDRQVDRLGERGEMGDQMPSWLGRL